MNTTNEIDAVVVGGGPAGAAFGLTWRRFTSRSVLIVERSSYEGRRIGETLPPGVAPLLTWLGVGDVLNQSGHMASAGTSAAWGGPRLVDRDFLFTGRGEGWHLDRLRFDRALSERLVAAGATLRIRTRLDGVDRLPDGRWRVTLAGHDGTRQVVVARFLVDASGKAARIAASCGARVLQHDRLVGVVGVFEHPQGFSNHSFTVVESIPEGWWYLALLPDGRMAVALMSDLDLVRHGGWHRPTAWQRMLESTSHVQSRLQGARLAGPLAVRPATSQRLDAAAGQGWIAVGESAVAFDPLSSMGIGYAINSGIHGARAVDAALQGHPDSLKTYSADVARHFEEFRTLQLQHYAMEARWPEAAFWARRHVRSSVASDRADDVLAGVGVR